MKIKGKHMGLAMLAVASVLLFNPDIAIFDILPDFIAYILIFSAITRMSYICPKIENARSKFIWAAAVSAAKFASLFLVFSISSQNEQPMALLLAAFSFAVIELILLIPAWSELFDGLLYLGSRTGAMIPYKSRRGRATITGFAKTVTIAFLFIKPACAVIPEFASLSMGGYDETKFNWYEFIGLFRDFGVIIGLVAGVFWLVVIERYWARLCRDTEFVPALQRKYDTEVLPDDIRFTRRKINMAFAVLAAAFLLEIDFIVEGNNIIPDTLAAVAFIAFFLILGSIYDKWKAGVAISSVYAVAAAVSDWLQFYFNENYFNASVWTSSDARSVFAVRYLFMILSSALFVAVVIFVMLALNQIIRDHAGFIAENSPASFRESKLAEIRKYLEKWVRVIAVMAAVCAVSFCIGDIIITYNSSLSVFHTAAGLMRTLSDVWWIISAVLCLINFLIVLKAESEIKAEIDSRYMLS